MVYSTCSMNPVENEAVVAEVKYECQNYSLKLLHREIYTGILFTSQSRS